MIDQINEAIMLIDKTTTLFYQQKNDEGYQLLDKTLNSLMQAVSSVLVQNSYGDQVRIDENKLNTILGNAMAAIETRDMVLLSDILIFDLKGLLKGHC